MTNISGEKVSTDDIVTSGEIKAHTSKSIYLLRACIYTWPWFSYMFLCLCEDLH